MKKFFVGWLLVSSLVLQNALAAPFVFPDAWSQRKETPVYGGVLRTPLLQAFKTFNPFTASFGYSVYNYLQADGLLMINPATGDFIPYMAESFSFSKDKKKLTFKLRRGMSWSDGKPVIADDFIIAQRIHADVNSPTGFRDWWMTDDKPMVVSKIDQYTLTFEFASPRSDALEMIGFLPAPSHIFKPVYDSKGWSGIAEMWSLDVDPKDVVSYGAFVLGSYTSERITFNRNQAFGDWNVDAKGRNLPYLSSRVYIRYNQSQAAEVAFMVGDLDQVDLRSADAVASVVSVTKSNPSVVVDTKGQPADQTAFMAFNSDAADVGAWFGNVEFRRAMSHLTNKKAMLDLVFGGLGTILTAPVNPSNASWLAKSVPDFSFNPSAALSLLQKIGFKRGADGVLVQNGKKLQFELLVSTEVEASRMAAIFRDEARKIGVVVIVRSVDQGTLITRLESKKFQAIIIAFGSSSLSMPLHSFLRCGDFYRLFRSKCVESWEKQIELLYQQADREFDQAKRRRFGFEIQRLAMQNQIYNYLVIGNVNYAWRNRLQGFYPQGVRSSIIGFGHGALLFFGKN